MNATCGAVGAGSEDPLECGHHLVNFKRHIGEHGVSRSLPMIGRSCPLGQRP